MAAARRWLHWPLVIVLALLAGGMTGSNPASKHGALRRQWSAQTGSPIVAKPAVRHGNVYVGSWDGYEYAYAEATGARRWRTYLGMSAAYCPQYDPLGVTSSPWLQDGVAYLGGGDSNWYALDATTGRVLWTIPTGDTSLTGGHYNWSSPVVHSGHAYIGIASHCDSPLVQGELLRVSLSTHRVVRVWKAVPDGQIGGGIWTSPVVDAKRSTVFVTTGNRAYDASADRQQYAEAMVALDATTLAVKSAWSLPVNDPTPDADWGTSPTLFRGTHGRELVSAVNKNGILYAFDRDKLGAGPVWRARLAVPQGGSDPGSGGGYSTGVFDGHRLVYAAGRTTIRGKRRPGSVRAIDPATGRFLWERPLPSQVYGALACANGMVVVPAIAALYVVDPATGGVLYANKLGNTIYGAATIANRRVFVGDTGGRLHAFRFPAAPRVDCPPLGPGPRRVLAKAGLRFRQGLGTFTVRIKRPRPGAPLSRIWVRLPRGVSALGRPSHTLRVRANGRLLSRRHESLRRGVLGVRLPRATRSVRIQLNQLRAAPALRRRLRDGRARISARVRAIDALGASHLLRLRFTAYAL